MSARRYFSVYEVLLPTRENNETHILCLEMAGGALTYGLACRGH